jgi:surface protein
MKSLSQIITEKLKIKKSNIQYKYFPKTRNQLMDVIEEKIENEKNIDERGNKTIDVSDIDISDLKKLSLVFSYYDNIKEITGLEYWDVSEIIDMHEMFYKCTNLQHVNGIENWDVSNCDKFEGMFHDCISLQKLDLTSWEIKPSALTTAMFKGCNTNAVKI